MISARDIVPAAGGQHVIGLELGIFIALFAVVAGIGFAAVRWRRAHSLGQH